MSRLNFAYSQKSCSPCKDCTKRVVGCHSSCESYCSWRNNQDIENARLHSEKHFEHIVEGLEYKKR